MISTHALTRSKTLACVVAVMLSATSCQGTSPVAPTDNVEGGLPGEVGNAHGKTLQGTTIEVIQGKIEHYLPNGDALVRLPDGKLEILEVSGGRRGAESIYYGSCPPVLWVIGDCVEGGGNSDLKSPSPLVNSVYTPAPTPAPTPTPRPASVLGTTPPLKTNGEGVLWLNTSSLYLSPNNDGRKETLIIDIVASPDMGPWELSIAGMNRTILRNTGTQLGFEWDIRDRSTGKSSIPDGTYTLKLTVNGLTRTQPVIIDTQAPSVQVYADNRLLESERVTIVDTVAPEFRLNVNDVLSGLGGLENFESVDFEVRPDRVKPRVAEEKKKFEPAPLPNQATLKYRVPVQEDSLLFAGTQTADFVVSDKAGNRAKPHVRFAVGAETSELYSPDLLSGGFDEDVYSLAGITDEAPPSTRNLNLSRRIYANSKILERYSRDSRYSVSEMKGRPAVARTWPKATAAEAAVLESSGLAGSRIAARMLATLLPALNIMVVSYATGELAGQVAAYVYADTEYRTLTDLINAGNAIVIDVPDIGRVLIDQRTWRHMYIEPTLEGIPKDPHREITPADAIDALTKAREMDGAAVEIWKNPIAPVNKLGVARRRGSVIDDYALVVLQKGNLNFYVIHNEPDRRTPNMFLRTAYGAQYKNGYPAPGVQWGYIKSKVSEYYRIDSDPRNPSYYTPAELEYYRTGNFEYDGKYTVFGAIASRAFSGSNPIGPSNAEYIQHIFGQIPGSPYEIRKFRGRYYERAVPREFK